MLTIITRTLVATPHRLECPLRLCLPCFRLCHEFCIHTLSPISDRVAAVSGRGGSLVDLGNEAELSGSGHAWDARSCRGRLDGRELRAITTRVLLHRGGDGRRELVDSSVEASGIRFLYDGSFFKRSLSLGRATPSRMRLGDGRWETGQETKVQESRKFCNRKIRPHREERRGKVVLQGAASRASRRA
jgi:hypothetical protein